MLWINPPKFISKEKSGDYSVYSYSKIASIKRALNLLYIYYDTMAQSQKLPEN